MLPGKWKITTNLPIRRKWSTAFRDIDGPSSIDEDFPFPSLYEDDDYDAAAFWLNAVKVCVTKKGEGKEGMDFWILTTDLRRCRNCVYVAIFVSAFCTIPEKCFAIRVSLSRHAATAWNSILRNEMFSDRLKRTNKTEEVIDKPLPGTESVLVI